MAAALKAAQSPPTGWTDETIHALKLRWHALERHPAVAQFKPPGTFLIDKATNKVESVCFYGGVSARLEVGAEQGLLRWLGHWKCAALSCSNGPPTPLSQTPRTQASRPGEDKLAP